MKDKNDSLPMPGSVVFFRRIKTSAQKKAKDIQLAGHGFGVLLGHVPLFAKDPPLQVVMMQMGSVGWISFDDVKAFLGDEASAECVRKFEEKYYPKLKVVTKEESPVPEIPA